MANPFKVRQAEITGVDSMKVIVEGKIPEEYLPEIQIAGANKIKYNDGLSLYKDNIEVEGQTEKVKFKTINNETLIGEGNLNAATAQSVIDEANARTSADNALQESVNQESITREQADNTLQTNINAKQNKLIAGTNITIDEATNTISATGGSGEPSEYIKKAEVSTNGYSLTLTKKDDSTVVFEPGAYSPFPPEFITDGNHSTEDFAKSVLKHSSFKAGMAWHGELRCGDLPCGLVNVECTVTALVHDKNDWRNNIAVIELSSSNQPPYKWEYNTNSFNQSDHNSWKLIPCIKESDCPPWQESGVNYDFILSSSLGAIKTKTIKSLTAGTNVTIGSDRKINVDLSGKADLPSELPPELKVPGVDYPWFMVNLDPKSIDAQGQLHLDHSGYNFNTKQYYTWTDKTIPLAATETAGGLMTAADKVKLNAAITEHQDISGKQDKLTVGTNITINENNVISADDQLPAYPTDTSAEYVLAIKYEDGAWKKYWKETVNKSDVVDSGMVDYMVLKQ